MAINPHRDTLISISQASNRFPVINGKRKSMKTLYRYTTTGVRGVVLEVYIDGNTVCTTDDAIKEFLAAVSATRSGSRPSSSRQESDLSRKRGKSPT